MFSTCLFCHGHLGRNEVLESFPVGRRLAFDSRRGRLWVVCTSCRNWNLSPLDERWETVEACERLYRATTIRVSTDNIGLATLRAGVDLVRVGTPLRPEFAAWRYGSRLRRRRLTLPAPTHTAAQFARTGAAMAAGATAALLGVGYAVSGHKGLLRMARPLERLEEQLQYDMVVAHIRTPDGALRPLRFSHVARLEIVASDHDAPWALRVAHVDGVTDFDATQAVQVASPLLARLNQRGGSLRQVDDATRRITEAGDAERFIRNSSALRVHRRRKNAIFWDDDVGVLGLTGTERLALEIAMNEDAERQAMQGELEALESAWRDAEEIAAIADAMFERP
ncbi:MAG: hypothetical protein LCH84_10055 [Gemmatimonadetes bacterium]|nr:hypothetical protein [Gemmatimonadota bacterium]